MTLELPTARELAIELLHNQHLVMRYRVETCRDVDDLARVLQDGEERADAPVYLVKPRMRGTHDPAGSAVPAGLLIYDYQNLRPEERMRHMVPGYIVHQLVAVNPTFEGDRVSKLDVRGSVFSVTTGPGFDAKLQGRQYLESLISGTVFQTEEIPPLIWNNTDTHRASVVMVRDPFPVNFRTSSLRDLDFSIAKYANIQRDYTAEMEQRIAQQSAAPELR